MRGQPQRRQGVWGHLRASAPTCEARGTSVAPLAYGTGRVTLPPTALRSTEPAWCLIFGETSSSSPPILGLGCMGTSVGFHRGDARLLLVPVTPVQGAACRGPARASTSRRGWAAAGSGPWRSRLAGSPAGEVSAGVCPRFLPSSSLRLFFSGWGGRQEAAWSVRVSPTPSSSSLGSPNPPQPLCTLWHGACPCRGVPFAAPRCFRL